MYHPAAALHQQSLRQTLLDDIAQVPTTLLEARRRRTEAPPEPAIELATADAPDADAPVAEAPDARGAEVRTPVAPDLSTTASQPEGSPSSEMPTALDAAWEAHPAAGDLVLAAPDATGSPPDDQMTLFHA
jgi:hypothetical protein